MEHGCEPVKEKAGFLFEVGRRAGGDFGDFAVEDPPAQRHSSTSKLAGQKIKRRAGKIRARVIAAFQNAGAVGLTDLEGQASTLICGDSWRPARIALERARLSSP